MTERATGNRPRRKNPHRLPHNRRSMAVPNGMTFGTVFLSAFALQSEKEKRARDLSKPCPGNPSETLNQKDRLDQFYERIVM